MHSRHHPHAKFQLAGAVGYWHSLATLTRWCTIRSYLDSAAAHGITALDAIGSAIAGKPWLPQFTAIS
jgi:hypothetical protein